MRFVCDEGVPRAFGKRLRDLGVDVSAPPKAWNGFSNGRLIAAVAAAGFEGLLTNDKNLGFQVNLLTVPIAIVSLPTNRRQNLVPRSEDIADTLRFVLRSQHVVIDSDGRRRIRRVGAGGDVIVEEMAPLAAFDL